MLILSQELISSNICKSCLIETEAVDQTFYLTQSQHTDTRPTSPCTDYVMPGAWQVATGMPEMNIHKSLVWLHLESDPWYRQVSNPGLPRLRQTPLPLGQLDCFSVCNDSTTVQIITFSLQVMGQVEAGDEMPIDSFTPSFKVTLWLFPFFYRWILHHTRFDWSSVWGMLWQETLTSLWVWLPETEELSVSATCFLCSANLRRHLSNRRWGHSSVKLIQIYKLWYTKVGRWSWRL